DPRSGAWKQIPLSQAKFNLRNFLQDRALYHPTFDTVVETGPAGRRETTTVDVGRPTIATFITSEGAPPKLPLDRKRGILGQVMTPALLGSMEKWATRRMQAHGLPCPEVKALGDPDTGEVH